MNYGSSQVATITITELSERTGLASSALRFYERKGLLRSVGRKGGKRIFDESAVEQIAAIDLLKLAGFTLAEAASIADAEGQIAADWRERARRKHDELQALRNELKLAQASLQHYIDCPADRLDACPVHRAIVAEHAARLWARGHAPGLVLRAFGNSAQRSTETREGAPS